MIPAFHEKEDFGDMDILILAKEDFGDIKAKLNSLYSPKGIFHNSNLYSFEYKDFQIDLIFTPKKNWETSKRFFAWGDCGNLIGKIFNKLNLKFGYDGLRYVYRHNNGKELDQITITKDLPKAVELLGLDSKKYKSGFKNSEELFNWIVGSKFFYSDSFKLENLNSINRQRNKNRKLYNEFITWAENKQFEPNAELIKLFEFIDENELAWLSILDKYFGSKAVEHYNALHLKASNNYIVKSKYNGDLVKEWTGLTGTELGNTIVKFNKHLELTFQDAYFEFFFMNSVEKIALYFKTWYEHNKIDLLKIN